MANSQTQFDCEEWVREEWMAQRFGQRFRRAHLPLPSGGVHSFDAVSVDGSIVAVISTSNARTAKGRNAVGKVNKIRSDLYFLHLAKPRRPLVILTEQDMYERCRADQRRGLIHKEIELMLARLPENLACRLREAKEKPPAEMTPAHQ